MARLYSLGLAAETITTLQLGVKEPYRRADGEWVENVLVYPLRRDVGSTRYACCNVEGVTRNAEHQVSWSAGSAQLVSLGEGCTTLLVCAHPIEAWSAWQAAAAIGVELAIVVSSQADILPQALLRADFWAGWSRVLVSERLPRTQFKRISQIGRRPLELFPGTPSAAPRASLEPADLDDWLAGLLEGRRTLVANTSLFDELVGDFSPDRACVHGGWSADRMLYAFSIERRERNVETGAIECRYHTLVVRSDGAVMQCVALAAPAGTPSENRVFALDDGTRVLPPLPSAPFSGWTLGSIRRFIADKQHGREYDGASAAELGAELVELLRCTVWLPDERDYMKVAAFIIATHFYRAFAAFPILFLNGPKGTGKTELASAVAAASFNGSVVSQASGAALMRLAGETGGLIAIDDAEMLNSGFGEFAQLLKQGYKAASAVKRLVVPGRGTVEIDFYGPRVVCNTRGLDDILKSRCVVVGTAAAPSHYEAVGAEASYEEWRDRMRTFAMWHSSQILDAAKASAIRPTDRQGEILLPLEVARDLASLARF